MLLTIPLFSQEFSSDEAEFNGEVLTLRGHVFLESDEGTITSATAHLFRVEEALEKAAFSGEVQIHSHRGFDLYCPTATFENSKDSPLFTASSLSEGKECHLTHNSDWVDARHVTIDFASSLLTLDAPEGILSSLFFPEKPDRTCHFSAIKMLWNHDENLLTLEGDFSLFDQTWGHLLGEDRLQLKQKKRFGRMTFERIEAHGKTVLKLFGGETLTSYGTLTLDGEALLITCLNPKGKQLIYENPLFEIHANQGTITHGFQGMELRPQTILLQGDVYLFSKEAQSPFEKGRADKLLYAIEKEEIQLSAATGHLVQFWDSEKQLYLQSKEVLIQGETIKGIGAVSISLNTEEDMP